MKANFGLTSRSIKVINADISMLILVLDLHVNKYIITVIFFKNCQIRSSMVKAPNLRVVQTKTILFLKSMSEKVGSDIERL